MLACSAAAMLAGCNQHFLVKKTDFSAANQCLSLQQEQHKTLIEQQARWLDTMDQLADTLSRPLQLEAPPVVLEQNNGQCEPQTEPSHAVAPLHVADTQKQLVGSLEKVWLPHMNMELEARIDSGAATASLDARDIQVFERDGEQWVRFSIQHPDSGDLKDFERKQVRVVRIIQSNVEDPERRPVIELQVVIGSIVQVAEFTLSDRSHLQHPVLIGRNILRDVMLVDVSQSYIAPPDHQPLRRR